MGWLMLVSLTVFGGFSSMAIEETYPLLQTRTGTYTNVTVTSKTPKYIFILHSAGMTTVQVKDLELEQQKELGYVKSGSQSPASLVFAKTLVPRFESKLEPLKAQWKKIPLNGLKPQPRIIYSAMAMLVVLHLFFSFCCHLICLKAQKPAGFLIWLPLFQIIPLLRAANMSGWWFLAWCLPLLNLVAMILWSFNIAKARGKSALTGLLMILPITNLFAFLYLAFSSGVPAQKAPRYQSMSLQTA